MNDENLIPFNERTESEVRDLATKGGIKSGESRRKRKALKEELILLLGEGDAQSRLCTALLERALGGDVKAFETVRDTIGEKPTDKTEFVGSLPPLVVRELKNDTGDGNSNAVSASDTNTPSE